MWDARVPGTDSRDPDAGGILAPNPGRGAISRVGVKRHGFW